MFAVLSVIGYNTGTSDSEGRFTTVTVLYTYRVEFKQHFENIITVFQLLFIIFVMSKLLVSRF